MAEHSTAAASGLRWPSNRCEAEENTTSTTKQRKKLQQAHKSRLSHYGKIHISGARRRWRRLEAGVTKPCGQEVERNEPKQKRQRAAADLAEAHRSWARGASATRVARGG
jgi:hypothetical protein